jgi:cohesin complex subunit SA-1/2
MSTIDNSRRKRKRAESNADDAVLGLEEDPFDRDDEQEVDDDGEDYPAPKAKPKTARKPKAPRGPPAVKKPRTAKSAVPKPPKAVGRKPRKGKAGDDAFDAAKITKETKINADNPLFSTS